MEVLNLKDSVEKDTFFRKLPNLAEQLPRPIVVKKVWAKTPVVLCICYVVHFCHVEVLRNFLSSDMCICLQLLPLLASALEFGSAAAPALNPLLKMGSWLPQDEFNVKVGIAGLI